MTNRRFTVLTFAAVALAAFLAPASASAQSIWDRIRDRAEQEQRGRDRDDDGRRNRRDDDWGRDRNRGGRMSDYERRQLRELARRIDDRSRDLRRDVDRLLDNSRINGSNREDRINNEARDLREAAQRFRNVAGDSDYLQGSRDEDWRRDRRDDDWGRNNRRGGRMSDYERRQLRELARRIEDRSRDLQRDVDHLLDNSRINGSNREDRINNEARDLREAAQRFRNVAGDSDYLQGSRDEAGRLLQEASRFSRMLSRVRLDSRTASDWNQIRSDLRGVANIYNLRFNDDRGYNGDDDWRRNRRYE